jgi:hypothetical protein
VLIHDLLFQGSPDSSGIAHASSGLDEKNAQQKNSALKPVVTEAEMSQSSDNNSNGSSNENSKNEVVAGNM